MFTHSKGKKIVPLITFIIVILSLKLEAAQCDTPTYCTGPASQSGQCQQSNQPSSSSCSCSDMGPGFTGNAACVDHLDAGACGNGAFCMNTVSCDYSACVGPITPPPPPPSCVPNGACMGPMPACGATGPGLDSCGQPCSVMGPTCPPPPPPPCVPNGLCTGPTPACGNVGPGADNCGNLCILTGPVCVGPCGNGIICGTVTAAEDGSLLQGIRVLAVDPQTSKTMKSALTDSSGAYSFAVAGTQSYDIVVPAGRRQLVTPSQIALTQSFDGNFVVRGVPAHLVFSGLKQGTFVLISKGPYTSAHPPSISSGMAAAYYSRTAGPDGFIHMDVPGGTGYVVTCWIPGNMPQSYSRVQSQALSQLSVVPESTVPAVCQ